MKNIAFAKIGKSIKFKSAYSPIGGDNEAPNVLCALANHNPDKTFYLVGRSDFSKLTDSERVNLFPYNNVIDCFASGESVMEWPHYLVDYFQNNKITIDFGIMMIGQVGTVTIPGKVEQVKDRSLIASVIDMTKNYSTPTIYWLNESKIPWVEILNDPRYTSAQSRDFINHPIVSLGQYEYTYTHNAIKSFDDQDRVDVDKKVYYAGMETAFCIGRDCPNITTPSNKPTRMIVILNEGSPSRYDMLNEWVLKHVDDVEIYGKWEHPKTVDDSRFKGSLHIDQIQRKVAAAKYTFIIPIRKGWATSKYIEMIHAGCIPFFHPTYDEQNNTGVQNILSVKKPSDLYTIMDELDNNPDMYQGLLNHLQKNVLKEEYYNGSFMNGKIMETCYKYMYDAEYELPDLSSFEKEEVITLF